MNTDTHITLKKETLQAFLSDTLSNPLTVILFSTYEKSITEKDQKNIQEACLKMKNAIHILQKKCAENSLSLPKG